VEGKTPLSVGRAKRIALIAETAADARDVMINGDSGILACTPKDYRPTFVANRRALVWPNGVEATVFSAIEPDQLRGPQFDTAWCDELGKWRYPQYAWDMLQMGLRLGTEFHPAQALVTTTPRPIDVLRNIISDPSTVQSVSSTYENANNLDPAFRAYIERKYMGTRLGRQEIEAAMLDDVMGALFSHANFDANRSRAAKLDRIVVAVDPPATSGENADECGIVVCGVSGDQRANLSHGYVLEDASIAMASPKAWAERVIEAYKFWGADCIVAEINQGGEMVEAVIRGIDANVPYKAVRAKFGKVARAEPVAALYEQNRVHHVGTHGGLEDQMVHFKIDGLEDRSKSPDRVDALVYALTELMIEPVERPSLLDVI
jgi:phage terminase large subunit-like protein